MNVIDDIKAKRESVYRLVRKHRAEKVWVFGSCARREERPDSDIDFLVKFGDDATMLSHVRLRRELADLFHRDVDVVSSRCVDDYPQYNFSRSVKSEGVPI